MAYELYLDRNGWAIRHVYSNYLVHHGIKGQQWGVRNGPPYPLKQGSIARKKLPKGLVGSTHEEALRDGQKRMQRLQSPSYKYPRSVSSSVLDEHPIEKLSELKRLDGTKSLEEVRYSINHSDILQQYGKISYAGNTALSGRHYNCPNCATAFEMTERGYDVCARPKQNRSNVGDIAAAFKDASLAHIGSTEFDKDNRLTTLYNKKEKALTSKGRSKALHAYWDCFDSYTNKIEKDIIDTVQKEPNSRGIIVVGWVDDSKGPSYRTRDFHAFNYKNDNGVVKIIDTQSRHKDLFMGYDARNERFLEGVDPREVYIMRTDNLELSEQVTTMVYSNKRK